MTEKTPLHEAIRQHLHSCSIKDSLSEGTVARRKLTFDHLMKEVGKDIQPKNITEMHIDRTFERLALTHRESTLNVDLSHLNQFFDWCRKRRITPATHDPSKRRRWKAMPAKKFMLDVNEFDDLLCEAQTQRDRMILSLGLYLFLRASEIQSLQVKDVDLDRGFVHVTVWKTKDRDTMPISAELDQELRAWLTHYTEQVGVLHPDYYLVPSRELSTSVYDSFARGFVVRDEPVEELRPTTKVAKPAMIVARALRKLGYPAIDGSTGETNRQGVHILRRSGARALFDQLRSEGYDGALQRVRVMLHHASVEMTELYLDIKLETQQRNEMFRGKPLFPNARRKADVVHLSDRRSG